MLLGVEGKEGVTAHQLVLAAVFPPGLPWHVERSQRSAAFNLAMGMHDVDHARLLVPAAELALLFSEVVEPGACLAILSRTDPDHDLCCGVELCRSRALAQVGFHRASCSL